MHRIALALALPFVLTGCSSEGAEAKPGAASPIEADAGGALPSTSPPITVDAAAADAATATVSVEAACARFADAVCGTVALRCGEAAFRGTFDDAITCRERIQLRCEQVSAADDTSWTPARRMDCASAIEALPTCESANNYWWIPACAALPGPRPFGAGCSTDGQCATGVCGFTTVTCGTCINKVPAGGLCGDYDLCADPGYECLCKGEDCAERRCDVTRKVGETCGPQSTCGDGTVCSQGTCVLAGAGAACKLHQDCAYPYACNGISKKCEERVVALPGAPCGKTASGGWAECAGSDCNLDDGASTGTCSTVVADGAACDATHTCKLLSTCAGGFCMPPVQVVCK